MKKICKLGGIKLSSAADEVRRLKKALEEAKERFDKEQESERRERLRPLRELATEAHALFCLYNHTDGCGWGYERNQVTLGEDAMWERGAHRHWLEKTEKWLSDSGMTLKELERVLSLYRDLKDQCPAFYRLFYHFK